MKIDKVSSERLSVMRFLLIVGVVFIHAYSTNVGLSSGVIGIADTSYWVNFTRNIISQGIARIAVPLFFLMAGYFFFLSFAWSAESYCKKIKSRINTLLIPFLFWNILTLFLYALAQYIPATQGFFSGKNETIATFRAYDYLNAILGIKGYPISYQFWFIRDLIVLVLLTPAIFLILKKIPDIFLVVIFILWLSGLWPIYIPSVEAFAFFYAGAYFAYSNISLFALDKFGFIFIVTYSCVLLVDTVTKSYLLNDYIHNVGIVFGVTSALFISKSLVEKDFIRKSLMWASGCSFFVFAVHEPLLTVFRKISYKIIMPNNDMTVLLLYFLLPILVIIISMLFYIGLKSCVPKFLTLITGGR